MTAFGALLALAAVDARAQSVIVTIDPAQSQGLDTSEIQSGMEQAISDQLQIGDGAYLDSVANAVAIASRGMGVDYATNPTTFVLGGAIGFGAASQGITLSAGDAALPSAGFAAAVSLMGGVNLGVLTASEDSALDRFRLYANGMVYSPGGEPAFDPRLLTVGGHLQIDLVRRSDLASVVEWGGLAFTTGAEYTQLSMGLTQELPIAFDPARWDATGSYDITSSVMSVPLELSTNLRVFVITAFVGGAVDFMPGTASSTVALTGPLVADVGGTEQPIGSVSVTHSDEGVSSAFTPRVFAGGQLNLSVIKVYTHVNVGLNSSASIQFGGRIAL
jgi:hypothetical protein